MDPFTTGALITGGASLLGGSLGQSAQARSNQKNRAQAERLFHLQASQDDTAHQRQVKDMRAAGLNPMLSGMGGSGANTSAGAMATSTPEDAMAKGVEAAIHSSLQVQRQEQDIKNLKAQENKTKKETEFIEKGMPVQEAKGKSGQMIKEGLDVISSAKNISQNIPVFKEKQKIKQSENKANFNYQLSKAARDKAAWRKRNKK